MLPSPIIHLHREAIAALAVRYRLPTAYAFRFYTASGGLLSYGIDPTDQARQAAGYVDRILKGESNPAIFRFSNQLNSNLVINLKDREGTWARPFRPHYSTTADEVIE